MKKTTLKDGTKIYCITSLEAQMLDVHVSEYFKNGIVINSKDTIIDVGANIGIFGRRILQQYKAEILAFEPIDIIFKVLEKNVKLSKNDKYKIFPYGISNKNESINFVYYPNCPALSTSSPEIWNDNQQLLLAIKGSLESAPKEWWWAKFIPTQFYFLISYWMKRNSKNIKCELKTLSYVIENNSLHKIDLLKIDCEGNELKVLEGIDEIHWPLIKQIVLEVHNIDDRLNKIINIIKKQGFKLKVEKEASLKETDLFNIYAKRI